MSNHDLTTGYRLIGELLLNPELRDQNRVNSLLADLNRDLPHIAEGVITFLATPGSSSRSEYVQTLELSPPCPLYLGAYLFDEPSTCNGVASSGRNSYMLELSGLYGHFGLDLAGIDLPDFLPAMIDFMWISSESEKPDGLALRRRFLEHHVQPAFKPMVESLDKYKSPYSLLISALAEIVEEDVLRMGDAPSWEAPDDDSGRAFPLPILSDSKRETPWQDLVLSEQEATA